MMNTPQYLSMRREAFRNDGLLPDPIGDYDINGTWDTTKYNNWQKVLVGWSRQNSRCAGEFVRREMQKRHFVWVLASTGRRELLTISGADQRISFSINLTHHSQDQRLSISSTSMYTYTESDMTNIPSGTATLAPDAPAIFDSSGNLNFYGWGGGNLNNTDARSAFLFQPVKQPYSSKTNFLNSNLDIAFQIAKGLQLSTNLGYNLAHRESDGYLSDIFLRSGK